MHHGFGERAEYAPFDCARQLHRRDCMSLITPYKMTPAVIPSAGFSLSFCFFASHVCAPRTVADNSWPTI